MVRAYPLHLRERVVAAVMAGQSCRAVASAFKVSAGSVVKWSQRYRATGSAAALPVGGGHWALAGERDWVRGRLTEKPDITLRQLQRELADRGIRVSYYAVWHFVDHEGFRVKKKRARRRTGSPRRRKATGKTRKGTSNRKRQ